RTGIAFERLAEHVLNVEQKRAIPETVLPLLTWIVEAANRLPPDHSNARIVAVKKAAIAALLTHVKETRFTEVCKVLSRTGDADVDPVLTKAAGDFGQSTEESRGLAAYCLALSKARQAERARPGSVEQIRLLDAAEKAFKAVAADFARVRFIDSDGYRTTFKDAAERHQYDV